MKAANGPVCLRGSSGGVCARSAPASLGAHVRAETAPTVAPRPTQDGLSLRSLLPLVLGQVTCWKPASFCATCFTTEPALTEVVGDAEALRAEFALTRLRGCVPCAEGPAQEARPPRPSGHGPLLLGPRPVVLYPGGPHCPTRPHLPRKWVDRQGRGAFRQQPGSEGCSAPDAPQKRSDSASTRSTSLPVTVTFGDHRDLWGAIGKWC